MKRAETLIVRRGTVQKSVQTLLLCAVALAHRPRTKYWTIVSEFLVLLGPFSGLKVQIQH